MAAYTSTEVGTPRQGYYALGDTVTDANGVVYECVRGGYASVNPALPGIAQFVGTAGTRAPALTLRKQAAPAAKTVSATLTAAELIGGLITGNQGAGAAANYTLPTGTDLETALLAIFPGLAADDSFEFNVINLSTVAAEDITLLTAAGWTLSGSMVVVEQTAANPAGSNGLFRARRTAANTYTLYRVA
jgi:hypothetical protein